MTLSIVQSASVTGASSSVTATLPGAPTEGHLLLLFTFYNANAAQDGAGIPPMSGWEPIAQWANSGGNAQVGAFVKYAKAGESASVVVTGWQGSGTNQRSAALYEIASDAGVPVVAGAATNAKDPAGTSHPFPSLDCAAGIAFAAAWLSSSGGSSTWLNTWTDSFVQSLLFSTSRAVVANRALTAPTTCAPTNTSAASKISANALVSIGEAGHRRPHLLQYALTSIVGNDPVATLTDTPTPGNLLLMIGTGRTDLGTAPAGMLSLGSAVEPGGFARIGAWWKPCGVGEATSYTLDTTTSERHTIVVAEIEQGALFPARLLAEFVSGASSTTMTSATLDRADGLALAFFRPSQEGGTPVLQNTWTAGFAGELVNRVAATSEPPLAFASRHLAGPVRSLATADTLSIARGYAGVIVTMDWAPRTELGRQGDGQAGFIDVPHIGRAVLLG